MKIKPLKFYLNNSTLLTLCSAMPADVDNIMQLCIKVEATCDTYMLHTTTVDTFFEMLSNKGSLILLVKKDEEIIALATLHNNFIQVLVAERWRRKRLGTMLTKLIFDKAHGTLCASVIKWSTPIQHLCKRFHFYDPPTEGSIFIPWMIADTNN